MYHRFFVLFSLLLSIMIGSVGCTYSSLPIQFYLLEPIQSADKTNSSVEQSISIILTPIKIPSYVNRPQMITALAKNEYSLSENHRWAEPLDDNITRVIKQNLSLSIPANIWLANTALAQPSNPFSLAVEITDIYMDATGQVHFNSWWNLYQHGKKVHTQQETCLLATENTHYNGMVNALNQCVNQLTESITQIMRGYAN